LKKYVKKIAFIILFFGCAFYFVLVRSATQAKDLVPEHSLKTDAVALPAVVIEKYSENLTKKIHRKLDSLLKRVHKRQDFHGTVLVAKNNKILYQNQIGYADFKKKLPLKETSIFQLASVSKQFTAAAIMMLVEQKKLHLSDSVQSYFPNFPYEGVTIQNLLHHTAGLPNYFWLAEHEWEQEHPPTNSEMMELLASSKVQRFFKPGRNFDYSNTGYFVLASIVEKISGTSFRTFLNTFIFEPLQMSNSYVYSFQKDSIHENQLHGYGLYRGWRHIKIRSTVNDAVVGDKNIYTTAEDLFKWTVGLHSGTLLKKESLDLMYSKGETIYGRKIPYGFGFRIDSKKDNILYHHGRWNGFSTGLTQYINENLVVIVLEHSSYNGIKSLNRKIKKIVVENFEG
jgi:CubicO group peptidase (beta-lactamase class C family)